MGNLKAAARSEICLNGEYSVSVIANGEGMKQSSSKVFGIKSNDFRSNNPVNHNSSTVISSLPARGRKLKLGTKSQDLRIKNTRRIVNTS